MSHERPSAGPGPVPGSRPSARRRIAATLVDDAAVAAGAAGLWLLARRRGRPGGGRVPRGTSVLLLSGPATLLLAALDASGGSPGKRLLGLRVVGGGPDPARVAPARALLRTAVKVGLPWELAHAAIWRLRAGGAAGRGGGVLLGASYAVAGAGLLPLLGPAGRPLHDRVAGTWVVHR